MIIDHLFDTVGAWWMELARVTIPPTPQDWSVIGDTLDTAAAQLQSVGALIVDSISVSSSAANPAFEMPLSSSQKPSDAMTTIRAQVPSPIAITLRGHTKLNKPSTTIAGAIELEANVSGLIQLTLKTYSDDWLPFSLNGTAQAEAAAMNAPILTAALHALEKTFHSEWYFESMTRFAKVDHYSLDNARDDDGDLVGIA